MSSKISLLVSTCILYRTTKLIRGSWMGTLSSFLLLHWMLCPARAVSRTYLSNELYEFRYHMCLLNMRTKSVIYFGSGLHKTRTGFLSPPVARYLAVTLTESAPFSCCNILVSVRNWKFHPGGRIKFFAVFFDSPIF